MAFLLPEASAPDGGCRPSTRNLGTSATARRRASPEASSAFCLTPVTEVTILADRGFGDIDLYDMLKAELRFVYIMRFRKCIIVRDGSGPTQRGGDWIPSNGRARLLPHARVTGAKLEAQASLP